MATSGHALFDRRCRLTIAHPASLDPDAPIDPFTNSTDIIEIDGGVSDDRAAAGMRVQFEVKKTLKKEPNMGSITVTNLSPTLRASLQQKGVRLLFEAGYKETGVSKYFSGDMRTADHVRAGADWESKMQLGDGERAWNYSRVNESFSAGTRFGDAAKRVAKAMGVGLGNLEAQTSSMDDVLDTGFAASGNAARALDQLMTSKGLEWSIQDNEIQILPFDDVLDLPIPEITPQTGLLDSPQMGSPPKKGKPALLVFKSLLIWTKPGAKVKLKSERYDGYVKVHACTFKGDTFGGDWETEIHGVIIK